MSLLIMPSTGAYTKTPPRESVYSFNKKTVKKGEKVYLPSKNKPKKNTKKKTKKNTKKKTNSKPKPPPRTLLPRKAKKVPTKFGKKTPKTDKESKADEKKSKKSKMKLTPRKPDKKAAIIYILSSRNFSPGCGCTQRNMLL